MAIYIRHGKDFQCIDGKNFDTSLTDEGKREAYRMGKKLVHITGMPKVIFCSPFYRTRQTAEMLAKSVRSVTGKNVPVIIDLELSRYPGPHSDYVGVVREDTRLLGFPIREHKRDFQRRVKTHLRETLKGVGKDIEWYVTHGIFIKYLSRMLRAPTPEHISAMHWVNASTKQTAWVMPSQKPPPPPSSKKPTEKTGRIALRPLPSTPKRKGKSSRRNK